MSIDNSYIAKDLTVKVKKDDVKLSTKPYVYKGDTGMIFEIAVDNWNYYFDRSPNAEVDVFTSDCKAMIEIVRPDGKLTKLIDVPIVDNEIHFRINKNISDLVGIYKIYVKVMKGRVVIATIPPFDYEVKDKPDFGNILPMDRGFLQVEDERLLCYDTLDDYGIKHISELTKTDTEKDLDELVLQQNGITTCITVGNFLKSTRDTAKNYTDTTATTIRGEISDLDTEHKNLVDTTKTELTELINSKDSSQSSALDTAKQELTNLITQKDTAQTEALQNTKTELTELVTRKDNAQTNALNLAKDELNQTITTKHTEAKQYTDTEVAKANSHSDTNLDTAKKYTDAKTLETLNNANSYSDQKLVEAKGYSDQKLVEAKTYSDTKLAEGKEYTDTKSTEALNNAKKYSDGKLTEANAHTDSEIVKVKQYSDTNLVTAKGYTDTELGKVKTELKGYSDTKLNESKEYTDAEILKVNNSATTNLAEAKKYTDTKLVEGKGYTDTKIKELVGLAPEDLNTLEEIGAFAKGNKELIDGFLAQLNNKSDKTHIHDIATDSANGFMSKEDFTKLKGIEEGANKYTHPKTHQASIIVQDATRRFVTDEEKDKWTNTKLDNVSIEEQEIVFKSENVEKFRLPLPKGFSGSYNDLSDKPSVFPPSTHTHTKSEITDMFNVISNLDSDSDTDVLSASQGKALKLRIDNIETVGSHFHNNKFELDKIVEGKVEEWNNKETIEGSQAKVDNAINSIKEGVSLEYSTLFKIEQIIKNNISNISSLQSDNTINKEKISTLESVSHNHTNKTTLDKITEEYLSNWNSALQNAKAYTDKVFGSINFNLTKKFTVSEWSLDDTTGLYKAEVVHNMNNDTLIIDSYDTLSKSNELVSYTVKDTNTITVLAKTNESIDIIIMCGNISAETYSSGSNIDDNGITEFTTWSSQKINTELDSKLQESKQYVDNKISESSVKKKIENVSNWENDVESGLFKARVTHNLNSENIILEAFNTNKSNEFVPFQIVDNNNIDIFSTNNNNTKILLLAL